MHAYVRGVSGFAGDLVLAEPIIRTLVAQNATAVGIDMHAVIVRPEFAVLKTLVHRVKTSSRRGSS